MTEIARHELPCVVFFNINGNGTGHLSRCLAYARRIRGRARPVFFSLASAIEVIHDMGFEADYFVSSFWSQATAWAWDRELALRLGMLFERVRPEVVVFDGTWPYRGLRHAAASYGVPHMVWSNRGLHKKDFRKVPVKESAFELVIEPGELGAEFAIERAETPGRKIMTPPVTLLREEELLDRDQARDALGLGRDGRYALFSLGPGNAKDISGIGQGLIEEMRRRGYIVVWTRAPITASDAALPDGVITIAEYPLVRFMRAFDVFIGAAGYNTCCEVLQSGIPALFVPNTIVADDQARRAEMVAEVAPAIVSPCETPEQRNRAAERLSELSSGMQIRGSAFNLDGAEYAADEILALIDTTGK